MSSEHVPLGDRTVVAIGGHDFTAAPGNFEIGQYLLGLAPVESPSVCLLPTASGDPVEQIARFRQFFGLRGCIVTHLSLFRLEQSSQSVAETLLAQNIIYVGGGSLINLIAILSAHGLGDVLAEAWSRGVIICGQSAGAMCWFEHGITRSSGSAGPAPGLGMIPGSISVHYHRDPDRRAVMLDLAGSTLAPGWGLDDQTALRFAGHEPAEAVVGRSGAGIWHVEGGAEEPLPTSRVRSELVANPIEDGAIAEMRALHANRSRFR